MAAHHRNIAFRPPRKERDSEAGAFALYLRFMRRYVVPFRAPLLLCAAVVAINSVWPYVIPFFTRIVVDDILVVKSAAADSGAAGAATATSREGGIPVGRPLPSHGLVRSDFPAGISARPPGAAGKLTLIFVLYVSAIAGFNVLGRYSSRLRIEIGQRITGRLREDMHEKIMRLSLSYHLTHTPGRLIARIVSDVGMVQDQMLATVLDVTAQLTMIVIGVVVLLTLEWRIALIVLLAVPPYVILYNRARVRLAATNRELRHTNACLYGLASQKLDAIRAIQSYARVAMERLTLHRLSACFLRDSLEQQRVSAGLGRGAGIISSVTTGVVFLFGAQLVMNGTMTLGKMLLIYGVAANLFGPVLALSQINVTITQLLVVLQRLVHVLDEPLEIQDAPDAVPFPAALQRGIVVRGLQFRYYAESEPVFYDVSLSVPKGSWLCVMGASGSGKTTLLYLLNRLYEPTAGEILIDGVPLNRIMLDSLRRRMALVPQEAQIFSGTIRDNICYAFPDAEPRQIVAAGRAAEIHDTIMDLPVHYETIVGQRGATLSGGQRQRISLARALLMNPEILLLDDCTSALDAETERRIQTTLASIMLGKTAIVVSQRVSMARRCHQICVLANGAVCELGTHDSLVRGGGFYARLVRQQTR